MKGKIISLSISIVIAFLISWGLTNYINDAPKREAESKVFNEKWSNMTKSIINMNCSKLIEIRLSSIQGVEPENYSGHWSEIRDVYNTKSCGNHWGWWED